MKKIMFTAMLVFAMCAGTTATAQSVNSASRSIKNIQSGGQRPQPMGDFCPCPCCRKDNQKGGNTTRMNGNSQPPQGHGMPPQGMNGNGRKMGNPPADFKKPECKCGKKCTKCDCSNSTSTSLKKSKKQKTTKKATNKKVDGVSGSSIQTSRTNR